ncbi:MAG: biotin--[acetyl-CoA-carboxylase] ligase [Balneolaceae bacterium]
MFNAEQFQGELETKWLGRDFVYREVTDSTNLELKRLPAEKLKHGTLLLADHQTRGRGQFERKWISEPGKNLTFTIAFQPSESHRLPLLTLATAVALSDACSRISELPFRVKWPNDLLVGGKKAGGILTECVFNGTCLERVLVGVGLNVNQTEFAGEIAGQAVSLASLCEKPVCREHLLAELLTEVEELYERWERLDPDLPALLNPCLCGYGEWITIRKNGDPLPGQFKFLGMDSKGRLLLLSEEMDVRRFSYEQIRIETTD